jgi:tyrosinase
MDRLWDVWTRKQQNLKLPYLPPAPDLKTLSDEPFLFYVDGKGNYITDGKAGDYLSTDVFEYDYAPGFGENVVTPPATAVSAKNAAPLARGTVRANAASVAVSNAVIRNHVADALPRPLMAQVTVPHPRATSSARSFDVLVNAPPGTPAGADSPFFAGTIGFFGNMPGMKMSHDATFVVPLPKNLQAFTAANAPNPTLGAPKNAKLAATNATTLNIRLVPSHGQSGPAPTIKAVSVGAS